MATTALTTTDRALTTTDVMTASGAFLRLYVTELHAGLLWSFAPVRGGAIMRRHLCRFLTFVYRQKKKTGALCSGLVLLHGCI
jgi:hypothetical protein